LLGGAFLGELFYAFSSASLYYAPYEDARAEWARLDLPHATRDAPPVDLTNVSIASVHATGSDLFVNVDFAEERYARKLLLIKMLPGGFATARVVFDTTHGQFFVDSRLVYSSSVGDADVTASVGDAQHAVSTWFEDGHVLTKSFLGDEVDATDLDLAGYKVLYFGRDLAVLAGTGREEDGRVLFRISTRSLRTIGVDQVYFAPNKYVAKHGTLLVDGCATAMLRTPLRRFRYRGQGVFVSWDLADLDQPVVEDTPRIYRVGPLDDAQGSFFSGWLSSRASVVLFKVDDDA